MTRKPVLSLALLALLTVPALLRSQDLTLDDAVSLALKGNRDVTNARLEIDRSDIGIAISRTWRLPSFQVSAFEGQFLGQVKFEVPAGAWGVYPGIGPIPAVQSPITTPAHPFTLLEAKASQPLSRLYGINIGIRLREIQREEAAEKLKAQQTLVVNQVRKLYYSILETQSAIDSGERSLETLREQDRVAAERVDRQAALQSEELDVKARIARVEYESAMQRHDLAARKEQLNDLLGRDLRTEFSARALPEDPLTTPGLKAARERALAERAEIREARLRIREAEADRDLKKSERIPEVTADLQYMSPFRINLLPENIMAAGFSLKWDVFDWGRRKKEIADKNIVVSQAGIALQSLESRIAFEVDSEYRKLEDSRRLLEVVKVAQEAARERVRITTERNAAGAALPKDLMEAQTSLTETDFQYRQALVAFMTARADFDKATAAP